MILVQILLPVFDNRGKAFPQIYHQEVKAELMHRFKGLTAYRRAPAEGLWRKARSTQREQIIVYEVMAGSLSARWWGTYRLRLEKRFRQKEVVIRAQEITVM